MKVRALRGVCIGINQHLVPGEVGDVDPALKSYLISIGAVEAVPEPAPKPAPIAAAAEQDTQPPAKPGTKEK